MAAEAGPPGNLDNSQLEVAIAALKEVLATDQESVPASYAGAAKTHVSICLKKQVLLPVWQTGAQWFGFHQHGVVMPVKPHLYYDELVA
jgi:hypothetical protein